jgi:hypothetical protein
MASVSSRRIVLRSRIRRLALFRSVLQPGNRFRKLLGSAILKLRELDVADAVFEELGLRLNDYFVATYEVITASSPLPSYSDLYRRPLGPSKS